MESLKRLALIACLLWAAPALACSVMEKAEPRVGSTVAAPGQVTLHFSGTVVATQSLVKVIDAQGADHANGAVTGSGDPVTTVSVPVGPLPPGRYKVKWEVECEEGCRNPGSYPFTVR